MPPNIKNTIIGSLLGSAVGDALGLPMEGLSKRRQRRLYPDINGYHLLFGRGMVSDDTEHTCMVARSLVTSGGDEGLFTKHLSREMKKWLMALPAGVGFATLRAILKLLVGFPAEKSGVFSAGNGPAMRSPIIGVCFGQTSGKSRNLVRISTRITHTDPKAEHGALAVAVAAGMAGRHEDDPADYLNMLNEALAPDAGEFLGVMNDALESYRAGNSTETFAAHLGLDKGISGYMYHTVPVVVHTWFRHPRDLRSGLIEVIKCGGDTDTTAAILGGILGAAVGKAGIPPEMIANLRDWPLTTRYLESLGKALGDGLAEGEPQSPRRLPFSGSLLRNLFFMIIVLIHGFRRLLPPY